MPLLEDTNKAGGSYLEGNGYCKATGRQAGTKSISFTCNKQRPDAPKPLARPVATPKLTRYAHGEDLMYRRSTARIVGALALFFASPSSAQIPRELRGPDLRITQGPGAEIHVTVRDLGPNDRRPDHVRGVVIVSVLIDGAAHRAGLITGDIVTEFDRLAVVDLAAFRKVVRDTPPDRAVTVAFWREGSRRETRVTPVRAAR